MIRRFAGDAGAGLAGGGADEQEAAELAFVHAGKNKSLAVLSRAGFSSADLATVAAAAARIPAHIHYLELARRNTQAWQVVR